MGREYIILFFIYCFFSIASTWKNGLEALKQYKNVSLELFSCKFNVYDSM